MTMEQLTKTDTSYELILRRLPDIKNIGGNRRHPNWWEEAKAFKNDRQMWIGAMLLAGCHPANIGDFPILAGRVGYTVKITTPAPRFPDEDNTQAALKPLLDLLEVPRFVKANVIRGYLGVIRDDKYLSRLEPIYWIAGDIESTHLCFWELVDDTA